jgi:transcriptional regulator with XRE-family HTH domain
MTPEEQIDVGSRIRELREGRGFSLRALAESSGLSINAISRIERGENSPTVSSLLMLAQALKVPIATFFTNEYQQTSNFVHRVGRLRYQEKSITMESLGAGLQNQQMEPFLMIIDHEVNSQTNSIIHPGEEFVYCLKGEAEYCVGRRRYQLKPGDSLLFKATQPHWCRKVTTIPLEIIVIFASNQENDIARQRHLEMHSKAVDS